MIAAFGAWIDIALRTTAIHPMKLSEIPAPNFDLTMALDSGQVFHWEKVGNGFVGAIGDRAVYVEQRRDVLRASVASASSRYSGKSAQDPQVTIRHYFALDHPLADICASFPSDPIMNEARDFCRGLRIIRQPKWECLATFICSSMKQVAHIRQISLALRRRFGDRRKVGDYVVHTFPPARRIARATEGDLRKCALGYRAKNLLASARLVGSGKCDLESWSALSDPDLREKLCSMPGVGAKIANCVMLFAYERLRSFPIDVWIERVLKQQYFPRKKKVSDLQLREFSETYFGAHGGYAQQYLFHHARMALRTSGTPRDSSTPLRSPRNDKKEWARMATNVTSSKRFLGPESGRVRNDKREDTRMASRRSRMAKKLNDGGGAPSRRRTRLAWGAVSTPGP
jgi:N-glycosylase/DNA lyase